MSKAKPTFFAYRLLAFQPALVKEPAAKWVLAQFESRYP